MAVVWYKDNRCFFYNFAGDFTGDFFIKSIIGTLKHFVKIDEVC
jgi:hypothetical protein